MTTKAFPSRNRSGNFPAEDTERKSATAKPLGVRNYGVNRDTLQYAAIAILGSLAIALGAATLPTSPQREEGAGETGTGEGAGGGSSSTTADDSPVNTIDFDIPFLSELLQLLALVLVVAFLWYLYHNRREMVAPMLAILAALLVYLYALPELTPGDKVPEFRFEFRNITSMGESGNGGQPGPTDPSLPSVLIVVVLLLAVGGLVVALMRMRSEDQDESESGEEIEEATAVGRAAGRAADRLEYGTSADNEIYRAWVEMTDLLSVPSQQTKTPGEFASAAIEAGMDPADVNELTELFEEVRYGDREPTSDDEQRAIDTFRRIESTYAEDEP